MSVTIGLVVRVDELERVEPGREVPRVAEDLLAERAAVPDGAVLVEHVIASDEFWTIARNSSSLSRSCASTSSFSSTIAAQRQRSSTASDWLISSSALAASTPLGDVARVDHDPVDDSVADQVRGDHLEPSVLAVDVADPHLERRAASCRRSLMRSGPKMPATSGTSSGCTMPESVKLAPICRPENRAVDGLRYLNVTGLAVHEHVVRRVLGQGAEPLLARAHRLLGPDARQRRDRARRRPRRAARAPHGEPGGSPCATRA